MTDKHLNLLKLYDNPYAEYVLKGAQLMDLILRLEAAEKVCINGDNMKCAFCIGDLMVHDQECPQLAEIAAWKKSKS